MNYLSGAIVVWNYVVDKNLQFTLMSYISNGKKRIVK